MPSVEIFDSLASTQALALERLRDGHKGPAWIMARQQTKGVGRFGREWHGARGNLMATRFEAMAVDLRALPQLSFVVALAIYETLYSGVPDAEAHLRIKWPNDLLYGGRKLAGILIQSEALPIPGMIGVAMGIGLNITAAPVTQKGPSASLKSLGSSLAALAPEALLTRLSGHLDGVIGLWRERGFDDLRRAWLKRAYGVDMTLSLKHDNRTVTGALKGLDAFGALEVLSEDGRVYTVTGGDISYEDRPHASGY